MSAYIPTIGLEIHAELNTSTKMFCDSRNDADEVQPNVNVCPICMGHPGTLPVINKEAVRHVLRVGTAVGGSLADYSEFDRKNYFYPDIPKNFQISQYKYPLVRGGAIGPVAITRIHLEEDTGSSSHGLETSLVNFNRAGVPLMELVTEPVMHDAETAVAFARDLRLLLLYLGASHANLEKGEMRIEANISISDKPEKLGTKVEVKNLNSFRAVEQAIQYEVKRQAEVLSRGEKVAQETRGWDESKQRTFSQRAKEESHDYRYFPEPDLPKLKLSEILEFSDDILRAELPETPWARRARYIEAGITEQQAYVLSGTPELARIFEEACVYLKDHRACTLAANYLCTDLIGLYNKKDNALLPLPSLKGAGLASIIQLSMDDKLSSRGAKDVLGYWAAEGGEPEDIAATHQLIQSSDEGHLMSLAIDILSAHSEVAAEYRAGKQAALQFLVGQGMKLSKGSANPQLLAQALEKAARAPTESA